MKVDISDLADIFASRIGRFVPDRQSLQDVQFLLENSYLNFEKLIFCKKLVFLEVVDKINSGKIPIFDVDGGKSEHMALKYIAKQLWSKYKPKAEVPFRGRIPDVSYKNEEHVYIIECGNTDPTKIFEYFEDEVVREVTIVPFPYADDKILFMYTFTPCADLVEFLAFLREEKAAKLKRFARK